MRLSAASFSCSRLLIVGVFVVPCNLLWSFFLYLSQSVALKLREDSELVRSCGNEIEVVIRKWSVAVGLDTGLTSHFAMYFSSPGVLNTLSGREYFLVHMCWSVRMPFGSAIDIS